MARWNCLPEASTCAFFAASSKRSAWDFVVVLLFAMAKGIADWSWCVRYSMS